MMGDSPVWDLKLVERNVMRDWVAIHAQGAQDLSKPLWTFFVLDRWLRKNRVETV